MARLGLYPDAPKIPCVIGYEVAGVIDQVGPSTRRLRRRRSGLRHAALRRLQRHHCRAGWRKRSACPTRCRSRRRAALPVVYLTAHHMLLYMGTLRPGMKVLLHSAAGGVGLAAIDILTAHGCEIIGTASPGKHDFLRARGVQALHRLDRRRAGGGARAHRRQRHHRSHLQRHRRQHAGSATTRSCRPAGASSATASRR